MVLKCTSLEFFRYDDDDTSRGLEVVQFPKFCVFKKAESFRGTFFQKFPRHRTKCFAVIGPVGAKMPVEEIPSATNLVFKSLAGIPFWGMLWKKDESFKNEFRLSWKVSMEMNITAESSLD